MNDITVVLVHTNKSAKHTENSTRQLTLQKIPFIVIDGDLINPFNYNKALNEGGKQVSTEYCLFANNDLIFHSGWEKHLIKGMVKSGVRSASPYCRKSLQKHRFRHNINIVMDKNIKWTGKWLAGWALCLRMDLWNQIGGFDERVDFWFSDNIYEWQLKNINEKHALILDSKVDHLGSSALNTIPKSERDTITYDQRQKYIQATGHNIKW